jgi:DNA-binding transcriptional regulator GbsR (MarR family)
MSAEKVLEMLKAAVKPLKASEIDEAASLGKKEVDKAMKVLKKEGRIE